MDSISKTTTAILLAAGSSNRFGQGNKLLIEIEVDGLKMPLFMHSVRKFCALVDQVVLVVPIGEKESFLNTILSCDHVDASKVVLVEGGCERSESVFNGVMTCGDNVEWVAIHDCARPFVSVESIKKVFAKAYEHGGAILASVMTDTVKRIDKDGKITETLNREELVRAETPQIFDYGVFREACEIVKKTEKSFTDDAAVMEFYGKSVYVVTHFGDNRKITFSSDIETR